MSRDHTWLTVPEYAGIKGMHPVTVRRLCKQGQICAEKVGGSWRVYYEPPEEMTRLDAATKRVINTTVQSCAVAVSSTIEALQAMQTELEEIQEGVCP